MTKVYRIMMQCPQTKNVLDTGIRTSGREALNCYTYRTGTVSCAYCGQTHSMEDDAFLELDCRSGDDDLWRPNP